MPSHAQINAEWDFTETHLTHITEVDGSGESKGAALRSSDLTFIAAVRVAVTPVLEDEDPNQVHQQAGHWDGQQPLVMNIWRLQGPLRGGEYRGKIKTPLLQPC